MILKYEGICIIPISRIKNESGEVADIIDVTYLDSIIRYADRKNLAVMYLSFSIGLVYYDTYIQNESRSFTLNKIWYAVVSEQVVRACLSYGVSKVYLMNNVRYGYDNLSKSIERRGVKVISPILGYKEDVIPKLLSIL